MARVLTGAGEAPVATDPYVMEVERWTELTGARYESAKESSSSWSRGVSFDPCDHELPAVERE